MDLAWSIVIAGVAIALAVFFGSAVVASAVRAFATVLHTALSSPARFRPHDDELELEDAIGEIRSHLPPWHAPTAIEVIAWQLAGVSGALFALRDRIGGSPPSAEEGKR
jgi:hypothetical protein